MCAITSPPLVSFPPSRTSRTRERRAHRAPVPRETWTAPRSHLGSLRIHARPRTLPDFTHTRIHQRWRSCCKPYHYHRHDGAISSWLFQGTVTSSSLPVRSMVRPPARTDSAHRSAMRSSLLGPALAASLLPPTRSPRPPARRYPASRVKATASSSSSKIARGSAAVLPRKGRAGAVILPPSSRRTLYVGQTSCTARKRLLWAERGWAVAVHRIDHSPSLRTTPPKKRFEYPTPRRAHQAGVVLAIILRVPVQQLRKQRYA